MKRCARGSTLLLAALAASLAPACGDVPAVPSVGTLRRAATLKPGVEKWRALVEKYFKKQNVTWALHVISCESGGDAHALNAQSGCSGLFQHRPQYWDQRARAAGWEGADVFDGEANIAVSAYMFYRDGSTGGKCQTLVPIDEPEYQPQYFDDGVQIAELPASQVQPHDGGQPPTGQSDSATVQPDGGVDTAPPPPAPPEQAPSPAAPQPEAEPEGPGDATQDVALIGGCALGGHDDALPDLSLLLLLGAVVLRRRARRGTARPPGREPPGRAIARAGRG